MAKQPHVRADICSAENLDIYAINFLADCINPYIGLSCYINFVDTENSFNIHLMNFASPIRTKLNDVGICHRREHEFCWEIQVVVHLSQILEYLSFLLAIQVHPLYGWSTTHSTLWTHCSSSASASHLTLWSSSSSTCYWIASCRWITSAWNSASTTWSL